MHIPTGVESADVPLEMTSEKLAQTIKENSLVAVDCWAPWCAPCNTVAPVIAKLAKDYAGRIRFGKLNIDRNYSL